MINLIDTLRFAVDRSALTESLIDIQDVATAIFDLKASGTSLTWKYYDITGTVQTASINLASIRGLGGGPTVVGLASHQVFVFGIAADAAIKTLTATAANTFYTYVQPAFTGDGITNTMTPSVVDNKARITMGVSGYASFHYLEQIQILSSTAGGRGQDGDFEVMIIQYDKDDNHKRTWVSPLFIEDPITSAITYEFEIDAPIFIVEAEDYFTVKYKFKSARTNDNIRFNFPADNPRLDEGFEIVFFERLSTPGPPGPPGPPGGYTARQIKQFVSDVLNEGEDDSDSDLIWDSNLGDTEEVPAVFGAIKDNAVTTDKIKDGAVTADKLASALTTIPSRTTFPVKVNNAYPSDAPQRFILTRDLAAKAEIPETFTFPSSNSETGVVSYVSSVTPRNGQSFSIPIIQRSPVSYANTPLNSIEFDRSQRFNNNQVDTITFRRASFITPLTFNGLTRLVVLTRNSGSTRQAEFSSRLGTANNEYYFPYNQSFYLNVPVSVAVIDKNLYTAKTEGTPAVPERKAGEWHLINGEYERVGAGPTLNKASKAEAEAGVDDEKFMTPAKTKDAIDFNKEVSAEYLEAVDTQPTDLSPYPAQSVLRVINPRPGKWLRVLGANANERHGFKVNLVADPNNPQQSSWIVGTELNYGLYFIGSNQYGDIFTEEGAPIARSKSPIMLLNIILEVTSVPAGANRQYGMTSTLTLGIRKTALNPQPTALFFRFYSGKPANNNQIDTVEFTRSADNPAHVYRTYIEKTGTTFTTEVEDILGIKYFRGFRANPATNNQIANPLIFHNAKTIIEIDPPLIKATTAEAQAGTLDTKYMTPAKVKSAINQNVPQVFRNDANVAGQLFRPSEFWVGTQTQWNAYTKKTDGVYFIISG